MLFAKDVERCVLLICRNHRVRVCEGKENMRGKLVISERSVDRLNDDGSVV